MSSLELKQRVIKRIDSIDNDQLLKEILHLINWEAEKNEIFEIPEKHKEGIQKGLDQIRSGETKSHKEVMDKLRSCH